MIKYLPILLFSLKILELNAQNIEFPQPGAQWNEATIHIESVPEIYDAERLEIHNDTSINSILYEKLIKTWSSSFYRSGYCDLNFTSNPEPSNSYIGAIRTNEENQIVFIPKEDTIEYIIYDFSLNPEDSLAWKRPDNENVFRAKVVKVDSLLIADNYRKKLTVKLGNGFEDQWIEGIGSTYGLLSNFYPRFWEKVELMLLCYNDANILEINFHESNCLWCSMITQIRESNKINKISINPNPVVDNLIISIADFDFYDVTIFDLLGRIIYSNNIPQSKELRIDKNELSKGLVTVIISKDHEILIERKIFIN